MSRLFSSAETDATRTKPAPVKVIPVDEAIADRFWACVEPGGWLGCWRWQGHIDRYGYGVMSRRDRKFLAHRVALALAGVSLAQSPVVDHLCRTRSCVNPLHLEPTTVRLNNARGTGSSAALIRARLEGRCVNGHVVAEVGLYRQRLSMTCAQCSRDAGRRYRARKRRTS